MTYPNELTNPAPANWPVRVNEALKSLRGPALYAPNDLTTTGLTLGYFGGYLGSTSIADGTVGPLASSNTSYVVAHLSTGAVTHATTTTNWDDTGTYGRLFEVATGASTITTTKDWRLMAGGIFHGGTGSVESVDASGGVQTVAGTPIIASGTIRAAEVFNAQTGTTYTVVTGDRGKLLTLSNAGAIAVTLPQAGGSFPDGWFVNVKCLGAGTATITPTTSTIDGSATLVLTTGQSARIVSDGTNYSSLFGAASLDADLVTIAGLTATTDNFLQAKSSAWASRTVAQVSADLQATGLVSDAVGFRTIPQNSQSAAYTTVAADSGKHLLHPSADTTARTFTIDSNANVAYPVGTAITFVNQSSAGVMTIAITSDTMRLAGAGTTGSRTLAANGVATALKITSTEWIISGTGLT